MLALLFGVIGSGILIMSCLFIYWFYFIYVDKDEENLKNQYTGINEDNEEENKSKTKLYPVDRNFLKKRRLKKINNNSKKSIKNTDKRKN